LSASKTSQDITQLSLQSNIEEEKKQGLRLYPNPGNGQYVIELKLGSEISAKAQIKIVNGMGQMVSTENAIMNRGVLRKEVTISSSLAAGIYTIQTVVANKIYVTKLNYQK